MGDFIGHLPNVWVRFHNSCKSLKTWQVGNGVWLALDQTHVWMEI
jgi:hypothetical protein